MASDMKMDIFAFNLFHKCRYDIDVLVDEPDVLSIYGDEFSRDDGYIEVCDEAFIKAVEDRRYLFSNFYYIPDTISKDVKQFKSLSEVCNYVIDICDRDELFSKLSVFERIFASADYVLSICYLIHIEVACLKDVLKYSHIFWEMYFDKFSEEFYKNGGWNKLKLVAKSYQLLEEMFGTLGLETFFRTLKRLKESMLNFDSFKRVLLFQNIKGIKRGVSMQWVKFSIEFFFSCARLPLDYEEYADANEVHLVLENARFCCDPSLYNKIYGKETIQQNSKKTSLIENAIFIENRLKIDTAFDNKISEVKELNGAYNVINAIAEREIGKNVASKLPETFNGNARTTRNKNEGSKITEFFSANLDPVTDEVFSINQNGKYECFTESVLKYFCDPKDIEGQRGFANNASETLNNKKESERNSFPERQIVSSRVKENVNQMVTSTGNGTSETGDELERTKKAREDLRNEKNDPEMKKLLRLVLLLGDKQGLKSLLMNSRGVNQEKKSNKKKRSKKKNMAFEPQNNTKPNQE